MKRHNLSYILIAILTLLIFSSCDQAVDKKTIILSITDALASEKQQFFNVAFQRSMTSNDMILNQLNGSANLKTGKYGYIAKSFFTVEDGKKLHYLHSISDNNAPIYLLESTELELNSAAHVNDSIFSPLKLNPALLSKWLAIADDVAIEDNDDTGIINIGLELKEKSIKIRWNKIEGSLIALVVITPDDYTYTWQFDYLNEEAYEVLYAENNNEFKGQIKEFL